MTDISKFSDEIIKRLYCGLETHQSNNPKITLPVILISKEHIPYNK